MKTLLLVSLLLAATPVRAQDTASDKLARIYKEEVDAALVYAPYNKTMYQLRGDAQVYAQHLLDFLADHYGYPAYKLPGIVFRPLLKDKDGGTGAAGLSSGCNWPPYTIQLNEILYYRNYDEFFRMVIPHEVSHVAACLKPTADGGGEHGPDWETAMRHLGFFNPHDEVTHKLDTEPLAHYQERIRELLQNTLK